MIFSINNLFSTKLFSVKLRPNVELTFVSQLTSIKSEAGLPLGSVCQVLIISFIAVLVLVMHYACIKKHQLM